MSLDEMREDMEEEDDKKPAEDFENKKLAHILLEAYELSEFLVSRKEKAKKTCKKLSDYR